LEGLRLAELRLAELRHLLLVLRNLLLELRNLLLNLGDTLPELLSVQLFHRLSGGLLVRDAPVNRVVRDRPSRDVRHRPVLLPGCVLDALWLLELGLLELRLCCPGELGLWLCGLLELRTLLELGL
jgi:hypothetical protein